MPAQPSPALQLPPLPPASNTAPNQQSTQQRPRTHIKRRVFTHKAEAAAGAAEANYVKAEAASASPTATSTATASAPQAILDTEPYPVLACARDPSASPPMRRGYLSASPDMPCTRSPSLSRGLSCPNGLPIDWNEQFKRINALPENTLPERFDKYQRLTSLHKNFLHMAVTFGKIIISEAFIDKQYRTIHVADVGGCAGGKKFLYNGIFFKFTTDLHHLYGGDENSIKAGGHELKGLMRYYGAPGIHTPLMALIDHRGFRLVAMSQLPIDGDSSIIYGSANSGMTVYASNLEFNNKMKEVAAKINIKGHMCGFNAKRMLYAPCDIEGHLGTDGEFYLVDFARVFPPTADENVAKTHLYHLLRPEFVTSKEYCPKPLSSDAFSSFGGEDNATTHNAEVREATRVLFQKRIPAFAAWLEGRNCADLKLPHQFAELLHRNGINVRYAALVLERLTSETLRSYLVHEMIARVAKNMLRELLRQTMRQRTTLEEDVFRQVIIVFLNAVLGKSSPIEFWNNDLIDKLEAHFAGCRRAKEFTSGIGDLRAHVDNFLLVSRLQVLAGVYLSALSLQEFQKNPTSFTVVTADIEQVEVREKHMNFICVAEANVLHLQAMDALRESSEASQRLLRLAMCKFENAIEATPDNKDILNNYATILRQYACSLPANTPILQYLDKSFRHYVLASNWEAVIVLGNEMLNLHPPWSEQDSVLKLATRCFSQALRYHSNIDVNALASNLCHLLIKRARKFNSGKLYEKAGKLMKELADPDPRHAAAQSASTVASMMEAQLHSLSLSSFVARWLMNPLRHVTPDLLRTLLTDSHVEKLDLVGCSLSKEMAGIIGLNAASLTHLSLSHISEEDAFELVSRCGRLRLLSMVKCSLRDSFLSVVASHCQHLEVLLFDRVKNIFRLPEDFGHDLKRVTLDRCPQLKDVGGLFATPRPALQRLSLAGCTSVADAPEFACRVAGACDGLTCLCLAGCTLTEAALVDVLKLSRLTQLDLSGCNIPPSAASALEAAVRRQAHSLTQLALPPFASIPLGEPLCRALACCARLTRLGLCGGKTTPADNVAHVIESCSCLTDLSLIDCVTSERLLQAISRCPLINLCLSGCRMPQGEAKFLARCSGLTSFIANNTDIEDREARAVFAGCAKLQTLRLRQCQKIENSTVEAIAVNLHALTTLDLSGCLVISSVKALAEGCPTLTKLNLSECAHISDESVMSLYSLPWIRKLNVSGCTRLTDASIISCLKPATLRHLIVGRNKTSDCCVEQCRKQRPDVNFEMTARIKVYKINRADAHAARARLMNDFRQIQRVQSTLPFVSAAPLEGNIFVWHANILGPDDSAYAGGVFHIELGFPHDYPNSPPYATLLVPLPHPHVHDNKICLDILSDYKDHFRSQKSEGDPIGWTSGYSVESLLMQLQTFLTNPEDDESPSSSDAYLQDILKAVEYSQTFSCSKCGHCSNNPCPPLPALLAPAENIVQEEEHRSIALEIPHCYHSQLSCNDDYLGFGVKPKYSQYQQFFGGRLFQSLSSPTEYLSYSAFMSGARKSLCNKSFSHWIPIYINTDHGARIKQLANESVSLLCTGRQNHFDPLDVLHVVPSLMISLVVKIMEGKTHASQKALDGYCAFHRLLLMFCTNYPELVTLADNTLHNFIVYPEYRTRQAVPDLGLIIILLFISRVSWAELSWSYLEEKFVRNVFHILKHSPELADCSGKPEIEAKRLRLSFKNTVVAARLLMFHVLFLETVARPPNTPLLLVAKKYDQLYGKLPNATKENLQAEIRNIQAVSNWRDFFQRIRVGYPGDDVLRGLFSRAIATSGTRNAASYYNLPPRM
eukprot:TRINITY_DN4515_c0_g1_i4.p1 TRINITY_DN4515_c0_g1~~TRINITY_DN4515_c0_g1_i4.p1  ORF type:complete len:1994 (+),score=419.79 TRINITY_DN4515_c0_g1_i4:519-5984(+)